MVVDISSVASRYLSISLSSLLVLGAEGSEGRRLRSFQ
jgi:hypothetical protein